MKKFSRNDAVLVTCLAVAAGMVGMAYAAVPLYFIFCRATGYAGTPARADTASKTIVGNRIITVRFDTNVDPALPWGFQPEQRSVKVKIGENRLVFFRAVNKGKDPIVGHAAFNVAPDNAARYFTKIQCFCFTEQRLKPGESVEMPVTFYIDPGILKDQNDDGVDEITLSYTFYRSAVTNTASVAKATGGGS